MSKCKPGRPSKKLAAGRRRRALFIARGLRSDGKPRAAAKPCGCTSSTCIKCADPSNRQIWTTEELAPMKADYDSGMTMAAVERKYGFKSKYLADIFRKRGYAIRPPVKRPKLGPGVKIPPATEAEITAMIAGLNKLAVPEGLRREWREWSLARRHAFVKRLRQTFPSNRPAGPFSANVTPFEYGTPLVHQIAAQMNQGRNSQNKIIALKPCSEGVICQGEIYFWDKNDSYVKGTRWTPELGRPLLKHVLWEQMTGQPVPPKFTVIQKDGNKNNFHPGNLALRSMADCARQNQAYARLKKNPNDPQVQATAEHVRGSLMKARTNRSREIIGALISKKANNELSHIKALASRKLVVA